MLATLIIPRQQTAPPPSQPSKVSRQAFPSIQTSRHLCPCLVCVINLSRYISLHQDFQNQLQVRSQQLKSAQCSKVTRVTSKKFNNSSEGKDQKLKSLFYDYWFLVSRIAGGSQSSDVGRSGWLCQPAWPTGHHGSPELFQPEHPWRVVQVEDGNHCDLTRPGWGRWWSAPTGPYRHHSSSLWRREMLRKIGV